MSAYLVWGFSVGVWQFKDTLVLLMMILPDAHTYAFVFKCTLACLHISISSRLVCRSSHGIFVFRVTRNDLKGLSRPNDLNMCMYDGGRLIYSEKTKVLSSASRMMTCLITSTFVLWVKGASRAKLPSIYCAWLLTLTSVTSFTEHGKLDWIKTLCNCMTHPDVLSEYG